MVLLRKIGQSFGWCLLLACAVKGGGAFQWVQVPPGERSSRKQSEQLWR
jgi:hypothetical protein